MFLDWVLGLEAGGSSIGLANLTSSEMIGFLLGRLFGYRCLLCD